MNDIIVVILLFSTVIALQYDTWIMALGTAIGALIIGSKKIPIGGAALFIFILRMFQVPSWELLSIVVIALAYTMFREGEEKPKPIPYFIGGVPPERY